MGLEDARGVVGSRRGGDYAALPPLLQKDFPLVALAACNHRSTRGGG